MTSHDTDPTPSFTTLSLHVGTSWYVVCHTYPDRPPILAVTAGPTSFALDPASDVVTTDHLPFARALLNEVNTYLVDCERVALAAQNDGPPAENAA
ncbi:hypothetical protein Franean1_6309 [Parafrankia sp. EAN1pec]|uniref:hypothetical protein n=1 Tax=Parafrankia sp. (strain EAN1pec) TaxID=298653 RepID=UPI0000543E50|nr:hypothetical protein Franean1_6309 [Frankia sp. EAN1pec]